MPIPSPPIIHFATSLRNTGVPGSEKQTRSRLEWSWGLGHDHLEEHLEQFSDPQGLLIDENVLVFPRNDIIQQISRHRGGRMGARRPHIRKLYNGVESFEYLIVPIAAAMNIAPRIVNLQVPPHIAICTTSGKMTHAWGLLPRKEWEANCVSLVERVSTVTCHNRPPLGKWQLTEMELIHRAWSWATYVPPKFLDADSDQTMVEPEDDRLPGTKRKSSDSVSRASTSASCREPKRRLLPCDLESASSADAVDDVHTTASRISCVNGNSGALAKMDGFVDKWLEKTQRLATRAFAAKTQDDDQSLVTDEQLKEYSMEQPRVVSELDLSQPDYLLKKRTAS
ncbi:hypothetical protein R3P38DRAFT_3251587 [Favolaschia claudopus]|uniref:DDE-1 domain-containing protein n=1 Tax=Favolaschia claudopus TaxID=2862362 RepID=A0AAW0EDS3_9AGAR